MNGKGDTRRPSVVDRQAFDSAWARTFSDDDVKAARRALARLDARRGEDIEEWADRLSQDMSKHND